MKALYILAAVLAVLFLLGQLRVGGRVEYRAEGLFAWARLGLIRFQVYPWKKEKREKPPKKKKAEKAKQETTLAQKVGGALDYAQSLLPIALEAAGQFYHKLRVDTLRLELTVGSPDPADAALRYGQATAALGALWEPLTQAFHVKDGTARVNLDFDSPGMRLYGEASLSLKLGQILWLALYFGGKALRTFLSVRSRRNENQPKRKAV